MSCVYCGDNEGGLTVDHLLARALGGNNSAFNLVTACRTCNLSKQDKSIRSWFRWLRRLGVDTTKIGRRIRGLVKRPLDMTAAKKHLEARKR